MEVIGLILGLLLAFALGYFAVNRLGRFIEKNLHAAFRHKDSDSDSGDQKDHREKTDNWTNHSCKW